MCQNDGLDKADTMGREKGRKGGRERGRAGTYREKTATRTAMRGSGKGRREERAAE